MKLISVLILSYLLGSIPWALVIGKVFYHKDVRNYGSGNLGASNAGRVLGKPAAIAVTLLDAFKAVFSMLFASMLAPSIIPYAGLACCVGHCFPIFAQFKGGKAVATSYGFLLGLCLLSTPHSWWWMFFFPIAVFFAVLWLTRIVSLSSISALGLEVIVSFVLNGPVQVSFSLLILWCFVTYRHKANLERIKNGTENKIKWMGERHGKN